MYLPLFIMINEIKDFALVDSEDTTGLLAHYRDQIALLNNERLSFIAEIEKLKVPQKEQHNLEWENYRLKNKVTDLERNLRELKVISLEERTFIIQLKTERDRLNEELAKEKLNDLLDPTGSIKVMDDT